MNNQIIVSTFRDINKIKKGSTRKNLTLRL